MISFSTKHWMLCVWCVCIRLSVIEAIEYGQQLLFHSILEMVNGNAFHLTWNWLASVENTIRFDVKCHDQWNWNELETNLAIVFYFTGNRQLWILIQTRSFHSFVHSIIRRRRRHHHQHLATNGNGMCWVRSVLYRFCVPVTISCDMLPLETNYFTAELILFHLPIELYWNRRV